MSNSKGQATLTPQPSWAFLKTFRCHGLTGVVSRSWAGVDPWLAVGRRASSAATTRLERIRKSWDRRLSSLGGDPSGRDWTQFRPLRLSREEDWSDWLAWLLHWSESGTLAHHLFGLLAPRARLLLVKPLVIREDMADDVARRADLTIKWAPDTVTFVEVKTGDQNLEKTAETAAGIWRKYGRPRFWRACILLPEGSLQEWRLFRAPLGRDAPWLIQELTWTSVATALRRALLKGDEGPMWRFWASSFAGAIEQKILELPPLIAFGSTGPSNAPALGVALDYLRLLAEE